MEEPDDIWVMMAVSSWHLQVAQVFFILSNDVIMLFAMYAFEAVKVLNVVALFLFASLM